MELDDWKELEGIESDKMDESDREFEQLMDNLSVNTSILDDCGYDEKYGNDSTSENDETDIEEVYVPPSSVRRSDKKRTRTKEGNIKVRRSKRLRSNSQLSVKHDS